MVREKVQPGRGVGGGCAAPWDMEEMVKRALDSQTGRMELAWHWTNRKISGLAARPHRSALQGLQQDA
eukprot:6146031-Pleurochrysis_carterae.AAC.1